ncbi:hypothetical protein JCM14036_28130 [Desulfotomaculum defluvii]
MINLILKDLLIQKKIILLGFIYIIFFSLIMQGAEVVVFPTALTALTYMFILTSCAYDEKNKADVMLNSLPLKRSTIVLAKYCSILVYITIGTVAYCLTTPIISFTGIPMKIYPISLEGLAGGLFAIGLLSSIYFPVYFKFGYIKSRLLNLILFFSIFFGISNIINFLYKHQELPWFQVIADFFQTKSDPQIFALIMGFILLMQTVSLALSLKFYHNRDI